MAASFWTELSESDVTKQIKGYLEARGWRIKRNQRTVVPGQFQAGEPGEPDLLAIRYLENGVALVLWIELKSPTDKRKCRCAQRKRGLCTPCAQEDWRTREIQRGGIVWRVDNLQKFADRYSATFGWVDAKENGRAQYSSTPKNLGTQSVSNLTENQVESKRNA